jgi:DNA-binding transcriptional MocR family regulator
MDECQKNGTDELPLIFYSTSKITFPGAGVAFMACKGKNLSDFKKMYSVQTVGFDKINQLRHLKFLKDKDTLYNHMKKHREILKPKFDMIINRLKSEFKDNPILLWNEPEGGYFISVETPTGCAKRVVELCRGAGVILTAAGATFPYGKDPNDSNIRLAPTYPAKEELGEAINLFCLCVKLAFVEKQIESFK